MQSSRYEEQTRAVTDLRRADGRLCTVFQHSGGLSTFVVSGGSTRSKHRKPKAGKAVRPNVGEGETATNGKIRGGASC